MEEALLRVGMPVQGRRRHPLLRPPRDQGRPRLPEGGRQPGRRGVGQAGAQRAQAGRRRQLRSAGSTPGRPPTASRSSRRCARRRRPASPAGPSAASTSSSTCSTTSPTSSPTGPAPVLEAALERSGYLAELQAEHSVEAEGRLENLAELIGFAREFETVDEFLEQVVAGGRHRRAARRRERLGRAHDDARGQGPRVPQRLHPRHGGRRLPAPAGARRAGRARGGAPPLLRRHHPGPAAALPHERLEPHALRLDAVQPAEPLPRRDPRRSCSRWPRAPATSGAGAAAAATGAGRAPARTPGHRAATASSTPPSRPRQQPRDRRARPGADALGLRAGDDVRHAKWGEGVDPRHHRRAARRPRPSSASRPSARSACCCRGRRSRRSDAAMPSASSDRHRPRSSGGGRSRRVPAPRRRWPHRVARRPRRPARRLRPAGAMRREYQHAGDHQPGRLGHRRGGSSAGYVAASTEHGAAARRTDHDGRRGRCARDRRRPRSVAAVRRADARAWRSSSHRQRPVRRRRPGPSRCNGFVGGWSHRARRSSRCAAAVSTVRPARLASPATPTARCSSASSLDRLDAGIRPADGPRRGRATLALAAAGGPAEPAQPAPRPTAPSIWATRWSNSLFTPPVRRRRVAVASEPLGRRRRRWVEVPDRSVVDRHGRRAVAVAPLA